MIEIRCNGPDCIVEKAEMLTSGMVGKMMHFTFDAAWDGLVRQVAMETRKVKFVDTLPPGNAIEIPAYMLAEPYTRLSVAVKGSTPDGELVIPSDYATLPPIQEGAYTAPVGDPPTSTEQMQGQIDRANVRAQYAADTAADAKSTADRVANAAENREFDGGYYTVTATASGDTVTLRFSASKPDMVAIPDQTITIPGADPADIARAVEDYLTAHPVQAPVQSVNGQTGVVALTAEDVGAIPAPEVPGKPGQVLTPGGWEDGVQVFTATITSENGRLVCDMTASQIIDADRQGIVKAVYTDSVSGETRVYYYAKQTDDGRAVFSKDGYIEDGAVKQALIIVDYAGNVTMDKRTAEGLPPIGPDDEGKVLRVQDGKPAWADGGVTPPEPPETPLNFVMVRGNTDGKGLFTPENAYQKKRAVDPPIDCTTKDLKVVLASAPDKITPETIAAGFIPVQVLLYEDAEGQKPLGWLHENGDITTSFTGAYNMVIEKPYVIPKGHYVRILLQSNSFSDFPPYCTKDYVKLSLIAADGVAQDEANVVDKAYLREDAVPPVSVYEANEAPSPLLLPDFTQADASTYRLDYAYGQSLTTVINEWMREYGGNLRKVPLIIHTDQHGRLGAQAMPVFDWLGTHVPWFNVSKILNLGDTVTDRWLDKYPDKPYLACSELDRALKTQRMIPMSKRIDIAGNHDCWCKNPETGDTMLLPSLTCLNPYFHSIFSRKHGNLFNFVTYDDVYNVKYLSIAGYEYKNGNRSVYRIGTEEMDWIIDQLSAKDGYDIVVLSHVPIWYQSKTNVYPTGMVSSTPDRMVVDTVANINTEQMWNCRKAKTAGTVTDSDGAVHEFDFSGCNSDILCGLHGHMHEDSYNWVAHSSEGLVNATFDWYPGDTLHFILIDRENRGVKVWKTDDTAQIWRYTMPMDKGAE